MIIFLIKFNHLFFYVRSCCDVGSFYYVVHISIISMVKSNIYEARCTLFESFLLDLVSHDKVFRKKKRGGGVGGGVFASHSQKKDADYMMA